MAWGRKDVTIRRPADWNGPERSGHVVSAWDVFDRKTGERIGVVAQDDVDPFEAGSARSLWHAWEEGCDEATGGRFWTREDAIEELLREAWANRGVVVTPDPKSVTIEWIPRKEEGDDRE